MTPDNSIVFLDRGTRVVNPRETKTPPPPMWGEEEEEDDHDPSEPFYDPRKDPTSKKFN